jgi:cytochrome c biogenesis DsbD-like protein/AhpC/TSA family protein
VQDSARRIAGSRSGVAPAGLRPGGDQLRFAGHLANFTERRGITYPLLSDPGSRTIKAYGILNTTIPPAGQTYGIPFPGTFMLNRHGVVTARYFENAYQQRHTVSSVLLEGGSRGIAGTRVSNGQIDLATYTSDDVAAPGTTFALVVDIAPKARVHVYAPGAADYRVVALKVDARPPIKIAPAQFPPSEIFYFAPLNERVPVYQKPFRLVQDIWLDPSAEARPLLRGIAAVTINATLEYQACDDKVCYPPESLPLSWTVKVRTLDTERPTPATRDR